MIFTNEAMIETLHRVATELGKTPTRNYWESHPELRPSARLYRVRFGSWNKALKIAGLTTNRENASKERVATDILRVAEELGHTPMLMEYLKLGRFSVPTIYTYLGHWHEAIERLGLKPAESAPVTKQQVLDSLLAVAQDLDKAPSADEYSAHELGFARATLLKHFSGHRAALAQAGLAHLMQRAGNEPWSKEEIIETFQEFFRVHGHSPTSESNRSYESPKLPAPDTFKKHFDSYWEAREAAGLPQPNRQRICKDGHIVQSHEEEKVDNFLFEQDIAHAIQVRVCPTRLWTCDFVVKDLWIEVDGFRGGRTGEALTFFNEKLDYYREHHFNLVVIRPHIGGWQSELIDALY